METDEQSRKRSRPDSTPVSEPQTLSEITDFYLSSLEPYAPGISEILKIPGVAVVGCQSVGKSSLFNALLEVKLFPTSAGLSTKAPILLTSRPGLEQKITVGIKECFTLEETSDEIARINNSLVRISTKTIPVTYSAPGATRFSYLDLPGHRAGQSVDDHNANKIIEEKIKIPNTLIILLAEAGVDFVNNPVFYMLQKKELLTSTILVYSKMSSHVTDDWMENEKKYHSSFPLGVFATSAGKNEEEIFQDPRFARIWGNVKTGVPALGQEVNKRIEEIRKLHLVEFKKLCQQEYENSVKANSELPPVRDPEVALYQMLVEIVQVIKDTFEGGIQGHAMSGAKMATFFSQVFSKEVAAIPTKIASMSQQKIFEIQQASNGFNNAFQTTGPVLYQKILMDQTNGLQDIETITDQAVEKIKAMMYESLRDFCNQKPMLEFPAFVVLFKESFSRLLEEKAKQVKEKCREHIKICQVFYSPIQVGTQCPNEAVQLSQYLKSTFFDPLQTSIPQTILYYLVKLFPSYLQKDFCDFKNKNLIASMKEDENLIKKRSDLENKMKLLRGFVTKLDTIA